MLPLGSDPFWCIVPAIMSWLFGILGAVASVLYWRHTVSLDPAFRLADWSVVAFDALIYAAGGFVLGWVVGFALSKIGAEGKW
jgi:hypothetical protein